MAVRTTAILIISNLLLGILFAVAHHVFYASLDGQVVANQHQQEWYLRIGTGLSFAVRTLLSASIGSAYVQLIWFNVKHTAISVNGLDALFGVLFNAWDLAVWELWKTRPMLTILAVTIWTLPLTSIVTPATLTIEVASDPRAYEVALSLPVPDYTETRKFADINEGYPSFQQASSRILRLFNSVTSLGTILTIPPPFPNSSYTLDFYGLSIACESLDTESNLVQLIVDVFGTKPGQYWGSIPYYAGFIPNSYCGNDNHCLNKQDGDDIAIRALHQTLNSTLVPHLTSYDNVSEEYAKAYVFVQNSASHPPFTIKISYTTIRLNGLSLKTAMSCRGQESDLCGANLSCLSILDALGKTLVGTVSWGDPQSDTYYSITPTRTQILATVLSQTWEFRTLSQMSQGPITIANISLAEALEQVVANTTLSLLADSYFLQDPRKTTSKVVTVRSPQNAYSYKPRNLLISYCLGCAVTTLVAAFGLICILMRSTAYAIRFSTILRTTQGLHADAGISPAETSGAEPLPPGLAETHVILRRQVTKSGDEDNGQAWAFSVMSQESKVARELSRGLSSESLFQLSVQVEPPTVVSAQFNHEGNI